MNDAIFAIPGLMPPYASRWRRKLVAPEDGSLRILLHCGFETDKVYYTVHIPGPDHGRIKDPGYPFKNHDLENHDMVKPAEKEVEKWAEFMYTRKALPPQTLIPIRMCRGIPTPITELTDAEDDEKVYFILELPESSLPWGDTVIEVSENGRVHNYIVQRPEFGVHSRYDRTHKWNRFKNEEPKAEVENPEPPVQEGEGFDHDDLP